MGVDPITFEAFRNGLVAVAEQMSAIIWRTSFSTIVREMLDYSTAIFDPRGRIDHCVVAPFGLLGGRPGACAEIAVESAGRLTRLPSEVASHPLARGDIFRMRTPGGGGYGDPRARARALVERDLREGKVTREAAAREYGA